MDSDICYLKNDPFSLEVLIFYVFYNVDRVNFIWPCFYSDEFFHVLLWNICLVLSGFMIVTLHPFACSFGCMFAFIVLLQN